MRCGMLATIFAAAVVAQHDLGRGGNVATDPGLLSKLDHSLDTWVPEVAISQEQRATRNARLLQKQLDAIDSSMTELIRKRAEADEKSGGKHNPALETQIKELSRERKTLKAQLAEALSEEHTMPHVLLNIPSTSEPSHADVATELRDTPLVPVKSMQTELHPVASEQLSEQLDEGSRRLMALPPVADMATSLSWGMPPSNTQVDALFSTFAGDVDSMAKWLMSDVAFTGGKLETQARSQEERVHNTAPFGEDSKSIGETKTSGDTPSPPMEPAPSFDAPLLESDPVPSLTEVSAVSTIDKSACQGGETSDPSIYKDCTEIVGSVTVKGAVTTNLDAFARVSKIVPSKSGSIDESKASLSIVDNSMLEDISGLSKLTKVEGSIVVKGNPKLASLSGLKNIGSIGSGMNGVGLVIEDNARLKDVASLSKVSHISGSVSLAANNAMERIGGLDRVASVGVNSAGVSLQVSKNVKLETVDGFQKLKGKLPGGVAITSNMALKSVPAMTNVESVGKDANGVGLKLAGNMVLEDISGVADLKSVSGSIQLSGNAALVDASPLGGVKSIGKSLKGHSVVLASNEKLKKVAIGAKQLPGAVQIVDSPAFSWTTDEAASFSPTRLGKDAQGVSLEVSRTAVTDTKALSQLVKAEGGIALTMNSELKKVEFSSLTSIGASKTNGRSVEVVGNQKLQQMKLDKVVQLSGGALVQSNANLATISLSGGSEEAQSIGKDKWGRSVTLVGNAKLSDVQSGATSLNGSLAVAGNDALKNFVGLGGTVSVGKNAAGVSLEIVSNKKLSSLEGLEAVTSLTGSLQVVGNPALVSLKGMSNVTSIGKDKSGRSIVAKDNSQLKSLTGLDRVKQTAGGIAVVGNTKMKSLAGISSIEKIGKTNKGKSLEVLDNADMTSLIPSLQAFMSGSANLADVLSGLGAEPLPTTTKSPKIKTTTKRPVRKASSAKLTKVDGSVTLSNNPKLRDTKGLESVSTLGKDTDSTSVLITNNPALENVQLALDGALQGSIEITQNKKLRMVSGFDRVPTVGANSLGQSVVVSGTSLSTLSAFAGLKSNVQGSIIIQNNPKLKSLKGLDGVTSVGKDNAGIGIELSSNTKLTSLDGLENVKQVGGSIAIQSNVAITSLHGLNSLTNVSGADILGDSVRITGNTMLKSVRALSNVTGALTGALSVTHNSKLQSLSGLEGIKSVGSNLLENSVEIENNALLSSLSGLKGLNGMLPAALVIRNNSGLLDLHGLEGVTGIKHRDRAQASLVVSDNKKLVDLDGLQNMGGALDGSIVVTNNVNLVSVGGIKGKRPVTASSRVQLESVKCISPSDAKYLTSLCASESCRKQIHTPKACSDEWYITTTLSLSGVSSTRQSLEVLSETIAHESGVAATQVRVSSLGNQASTDAASSLQVLIATRGGDEQAIVAQAAAIAKKLTSISQNTESLTLYTTAMFIVQHVAEFGVQLKIKFTTPVQITTSKPAALGSTTTTVVPTTTTTVERTTTTPATTSATSTTTTTTTTATTTTATTTAATTTTTTTPTTTTTKVPCPPTNKRFCRCGRVMLGLCPSNECKPCITTGRPVIKCALDRLSAVSVSFQQCTTKVNPAAGHFTTHYCKCISEYIAAMVRMKGCDKHTDPIIQGTRLTANSLRCKLVATTTKAPTMRLTSLSVRSAIKVNGVRASALTVVEEKLVHNALAFELGVDPSQVKLSNAQTIMIAGTVRWATKMDVTITTKPGTLQMAAFQGAQIELAIKRVKTDSMSLMSRIQLGAVEASENLPPHFNVKVIEEVTLGPTPVSGVEKPPSTMLKPQSMPKTTTSTTTAASSATSTTSTAVFSPNLPVVDCELGPFTDWTTCDVACGGGTQFRTRPIVTAPSNGGKACAEGRFEERNCNENVCPYGCMHHGYHQWSKCTRSCGGGVQRRSVRTIPQQRLTGGTSCPTAQERVCNTQPCATRTTSAPAATTTTTSVHDWFSNLMTEIQGLAEKKQSKLPAAPTSRSSAPPKKACAEGKYVHEATWNGHDVLYCIACPRGKFSDAVGSPVCKRCAVGRVADGYAQTKCSACAAGRYGDSIFSRPICLNCPKGKFQPASGKARCDECPQDTYGVAESSTSSVVCKKCPAGRFSAGGVDTCVEGNKPSCPTHNCTIPEPGCRYVPNSDVDHATGCKKFPCGRLICPQPTPRPCSHMKCQYSDHYPGTPGDLPSTTIHVMHHFREMLGNKHVCRHDKKSGTCSCQCMFKPDTDAVDGVLDLSAAKTLRNTLHDQWLGYDLRIFFKADSRWYDASVTGTWIQRHGKGWRALMQLTFAATGDTESYTQREFLQLKRKWDKFRDAVIAAENRKKIALPGFKPVARR